MAKKRAEPRRMSTPTPFEQARDELFSHILRCGVLEASAEHQKEWFDDTMQYLADRYDGLDEPQLTELRVLGDADAERALVVAGGQRECEPPLRSGAPRHAELRSPEGAVRHHQHRTDTRFGRRERLGARRRRGEGRAGAQDRGAGERPSEARRRS